MAIIIAKRNGGFVGRNAKLLYIRENVLTAYYGLLYNWWGATDSRNISSSGWKVPAYSDIETFYTYLDPYTTAAIKLKEAGTTYWTDARTSDNSAKFNGRGAGERSVTGVCSNLRVTFYMWETTVFEYDSTLAYSYYMNNSSDYLIYYNAFNKHTGYSVRLVKESTSLSNGETGMYTGNDGKKYRTICIGTQEWLADNLCETKYRNGDIIPWYGAAQANYFTNAEWAALSTAGVCAYNNDMTKVCENFSFPTS